MADLTIGSVVGYTPPIGVANLDIGHTPDEDRLAVLAGSTATIGNAVAVLRPVITSHAAGDTKATGQITATLRPVITCTIAGEIVAVTGNITATVIPVVDCAFAGTAQATGNVVASLHPIITGTFAGTTVTTGQIIIPDFICVIAGVTTNATGEITANYDPHLLDQLTNSASEYWDDSLHVDLHVIDSAKQATAITIAVTDTVVDASLVATSVPEQLLQACHVDAVGVTAYGQGDSLPSIAQAVWWQAMALQAQGITDWDGGEVLIAVATNYYANLPTLLAECGDAWDYGNLTQTIRQDFFGDGSFFATTLIDNWDQATYCPNAIKAPPVIPPVPPPAYTPSANLAIRCALPGTTLCIRSSGCCNEAGITVPIRSVYVVNNSFSLVRVADNNPIDCFSFSASLGHDAWTWSWNATTSPYQLDRVFVDNIYEPIEVIATLNGIPLRLLIESLSRDRQFGSTSVKIAGRGRTAWLAAPYSPILTFGNDSDLTANQLAESVLMLNGSSIGWAVDWAIDDWLITSKAWSQYCTYIEALAKIADAGGGYLQPHDTSQTIRFLPYYPTPPWQWSNVVPDLALPDAVVTVEGIVWTSKMIYDSVYVVGGAYGGRTDRVMRTGMGALVPAPTVQDDLATDPVMTRNRGIRVLGDCGRQAIITLKLPILATTGIIRPGVMVSYTAASIEHIGIVRSVKVDYTFPEAWQTIEVETNESI